MRTSSAYKRGLQAQTQNQNQPKTSRPKIKKAGHRRKQSGSKTTRQHGLARAEKPAVKPHTKPRGQHKRLQSSSGLSSKIKSNLNLEWKKSKGLTRSNSTYY